MLQINITNGWEKLTREHTAKSGNNRFASRGSDKLS